jgi:predicted RNA-binding protein with TRAM domain
MNSGSFGTQGVPSSIKEGDQYKVRIVDVGKQGDGIAKLEGLIIFVPGTKPGDEVEVRIKRLGKNCAFADKIE